MRARLLGLAGVAVAVAATGWAFAGEPTHQSSRSSDRRGAGARRCCRLARGWRRIGPRHPCRTAAASSPWGALVAVTAAIGLVATVIVGPTQPRYSSALSGLRPSSGHFRGTLAALSRAGPCGPLAGSERSCEHTASRRAAGAGPSRRWGRLVPGCWSSPQTGRGPTSCSATMPSRSLRWRESNCASRTTHSLRSGYGSGPGHGRG